MGGGVAWKWCRGSQTHSANAVQTAEPCARDDRGTGSGVGDVVRGADGAVGARRGEEEGVGGGVVGGEAEDETGGGEPGCALDLRRGRSGRWSVAEVFGDKESGAKRFPW